MSVNGAIVINCNQFNDKRLKNDGVNVINPEMTKTRLLKRRLIYRFILVVNHIERVIIKAYIHTYIYI